MVCIDSYCIIYAHLSTHTRFLMVWLIWHVPFLTISLMTIIEWQNITVSICVEVYKMETKIAYKYVFIHTSTATQ